MAEPARQEVAQALDQLVGLASAELSRQSALPVPAGIRLEVERWLASEQATFALAKRLTAALRANDVAEVQRLSLALQRESALAGLRARRIGLRVCTGPTG